MSREYAAKLKERGLCHNCCKPSRPGKQICASCNEKQRSAFFQRREQRRRDGLCWKCGSENPTGKVCAACRKKMNAANLRRLARKHANGVCEHCTKPAKPGQRKCAQHSKRQVRQVHESILRGGLIHSRVLRDWRANNPTKKQAADKRASAERRRRRAENPVPFRAKEQAYWDAHREQHRMKTVRREAKKVGAKGTHTVGQWLNRVEYHGWRCRWCSKKLTPKTLTKDHVIPLSKGGTNFASNLVPSCFSCNSSKQAKPYQQFLPTGPPDSG